MKGDRDKVLARLEELRERSSIGRLTADAVVKDARNPKSPLHGEFEWDIKRAAQQHWIATARGLITTFEVTIKTTTSQIAVPYYVRDPRAGPSEQGYVATADIRNEEDLAREVLIEEFKRAGSVLKRAKALSIAFEMADEVEAVVEKIDKLRSRVELRQ